MKTASILLAVVAVLGFVREAGALYRVETDHDYTVTLIGERFGFCDGTMRGDHFVKHSSAIFLGKLGKHRVPFTATQGLVGFGLILAMLIIVPMAVLSVRWKKKRVAP